VVTICTPAACVCVKRTRLYLHAGGSAFLTLNPCISSSRATHPREGSAGASPRQNWITDRPTTKKVEVQQKQVCLTCSGRWEGCGMRRHRCRCCCCCMASGAGAPQRCCCCCSFGRRENGMQKVIERERAKGVHERSCCCYGRAGSLSTE
jgi:hypothetical protein